jgi:hypothetical protein
VVEEQRQTQIPCGNDKTRKEQRQRQRQKQIPFGNDKTRKGATTTAKAEADSLRE